MATGTRNHFGWTRKEYRLAGAAGLVATVYGAFEWIVVYQTAFNYGTILTLAAFGTTALMAYRFKTFNKAR